MNPGERYMQYKDDYFDTVLLKIRKGYIKCGKYAHMVKIDKNKKYNGKELFNDGKDKDE